MDVSLARGEGGFSLLEVFIALLILLAGLLVLAMVQLTAISERNPNLSIRGREATDLAQAALDQLSRIPWNDLRSSAAEGFRQGPDGYSPDVSRLPAAAGDSIVVGGAAYFRLWRVTRDPEIPALKTITVWCCWRQGERAWRQVVLVTQRADMDN